MRLALVVVLLAGCQEPKNFPPSPGGGGGVPGGGSNEVETDAAADGSLLVDARICVVRDLRQLATCDDTGAAGLAVTIGNAQAVTADDGTFQIDTPNSTGLVWKVTHPDFVTTLAQLSPILLVPAIRTDDYADLLGDNGLVLTPGQASLVVQVLDNDVALAGSTATTSPQGQFPTRYDGTSATIWDQDATSTFGVAWLPGLSGTSTSLTVTSPVDDPFTSLVPLQADAITFATIAF